MLLSKVSIKRPYFATMINLLILIFGIMAYPKLGIDRNPNVDMPFVYVFINYEGANPKTSEQLLLKPMEEKFKGLTGLKKMDGSAMQNGAFVLLEFNLDVNGDKAAADVRNAMTAIDFPKEVGKPYIEKFNQNSRPFINISVSSNKLSLQELSNFAINDLKPQLQRIDGVGRISIAGAQDREVQIYLNSSLINAMKLSPTSLEDKIKNQIINKPAGTLREPTNSMGISTYSIPSNIERLLKLPITLENNKIIRLEDISTIHNSLAEAHSYGEYNGNRTIIVRISKQSQGNIVKISENIKKRVEQIKKENAGKIDLNITSDDSTYIKNSFNNVKFDLILGSLLAVLVVFIFLHDWKNTLICAIAIPTSLIGTLAIAHALNFTLNFITLLALTLSIGILVDDAIVVIENIHRHRLLGKNAFKAAEEGTAEIGLAALAVTLAIVAVFIPVAFMDGLIGRFFYEFGIMVASAVLISLFVAFTIVPMMSSRLLNKEHKQAHEKIKIAEQFDYYFEKIQLFYQKTLKKLLRFKKTTVASGIGVLIISIVLLKFVPVEFQPVTDDSRADFTFTLSQGTPLSISIERAKELENYIRKYSGVEKVIMDIGSDDSGSASKINYTIMLVKPDKRTFTKNEFTEYLTNDAKKFIKDPKEKIGYESGNSPIQVNLISSNIDAMSNYSKELIKYMNSLPGVKDATTSVEDPAFELRIVPNSLKAASMNVNPNDIANTVKLLFGGVKVGDFYADGRFYDIKIMLPRENDKSINDLTGVLIPSTNGNPVLLSSIATIEKVPIDPVINHQNGDNVVTVKANYFGKDLNGITKQIQEHVNKTKPFGVYNNLGGDSGDLQDVILTISITLALAVIFIFMVLCAQFENFIGPFSIMLSIPLAFSGAFLALLITKQSLSIFAMIGIIMLMGLVTKNAILLVEFAQQKLAEGFPVDKALLEAALVRFRPIMMTTLTMIAGMLPMVLSNSEGSEVMRNMGVTVIGGLISSTLLTLLIVPCAYSILISFKNKKLLTKTKLSFKKKTI